MAVPKLRFPEFTDDWEQRKLGDLYTERNERGNGSLQILSVSIHTGVSDGELDVDNLGKFVRRSEDKSTYKHVHSGDLIFNMMRAWQGAIGVAKTEGMISPAYISAIPSEDIYPPFMNYLLRRKNVINQINNLSYGVTDFRKRLYWNSFVQVNCKLPSVEEQRNITDVFEKIDHLITLHQRKLDDIKLLKKSMLQKMFPAEGRDVPEVRFPGFTAAWEQRKLSQIYSTIRNAFVGTATPYYVDDGHFYLESNNVKDGQINHNTEVFINDEFYKKQKGKWLHTGDLVMVQSGHVGHTAVIPPELDNTAAHALIMFQHPKQEIEPYFLNYELQTLSAKKKIADITTGNTIKHILASEMQEFVMDLPSILEQRRIAAFFRQIDNTITLHQRKCDDLQKLKKALLQQMFC